MAPAPLFDVPASDVLRLIQAHLIEIGYKDTVRAMQDESNGRIGLAGLPMASNLQFYAGSGQWSSILQSLSLLDRKRSRIPQDLVAEVHEMTILELADAGDMQLAYATYQLAREELENSLVNNDSVAGTATGGRNNNKMTRARLLEQKLAELASLRSKDPKCNVPDDYYCAKGGGSSKQARRDRIGQRLAKSVPQQPTQRLTTLLQQAIKWQCYTGQINKFKQLWCDDEDDEDDNNEDKREAQGGDDMKKKSNKKRKRSSTKKAFDLVLGEVHVDAIAVGDAATSSQANNRAAAAEPIASDPYSTVKLGKKCTCESMAFLPDGSGLITGSSDGLIEIWDAAESKYTSLSTNFPYQEKDELMGHDDTAVTALVVANDGTLLGSGDSKGHVKVWNLASGQCLREWQAHSETTISCLAFSQDASHVLTASRDGICREFGLRTTRMLKEFRGHLSYITKCYYQIINNDDDSSELLVVVTASGDGTVRVWNRTSLDAMYVLKPVLLGGKSSISKIGSSLIVNNAELSSASSAGPAPAIVAAISLHTPANTMVVVPRANRAFMVNYQGTVMRVFQDYETSKAGSSSKEAPVFVAATVTATNRWLFAVRDDGVCCVFDVTNGQLERTIRDFGLETTRMPKGSSAVAEVSSIASHPNKSIVAAFSNHKGQKRGQVQLWK